ncbi:hypothetical protein [Komagataeibacter medellinensis]|uniref:hypothetical protein n=1 Tax=Komagataeibacter medellinensis TaxID=1177712 RepID=UPI0011D18A72|nr:hypothetical protein [Komagataeibacter medellinensis]
MEAFGKAVLKHQKTAPSVKILHPEILLLQKVSSSFRHAPTEPAGTRQENRNPGYTHPMPQGLAGRQRCAHHPRHKENRGG